MPSLTPPFSRSSLARTTAAALCVGLILVSPGGVQPTAQNQAADVGSPSYRETIAGTLVSFEMVRVPGGPVIVNGKPGEVKPFYLGRMEVTWDLYDVFALGLDKTEAAPGADAIARPSQPYGAPDHGWGHAGYPVISVTRAAAEAFCKWLSTKTGKAYRLPTDAEWTRAADLAKVDAKERDGTTWHRGNAGGKTHAVGAKSPDALGLHDLFGNAAEWVMTPGDDLIVRGGSFRDGPESTGPGARGIQDDSWNERDPQLPKSRWWLSDAPFVGFRIARDLE